MEIPPEVLAIADEVIALRRQFHQHPELGHEEFQTAEKIVEYLRDCNLSVQTGVNKTGVVGLLEGAYAGPTLMLRADMDALPIQEDCDVPYRSTNDGKMHACGHDAHTAMLMVAAKILSGFKEHLNGNIKFVFEPNEENVGALAMIEEGIMDNPRVNACMGLHVWNQLPIGTVGISAGPIMAGMAHFEITVKGIGGHTATPQSAVDPILTAAAIIQGVQAIQTREIDALKEPTIIMFGKIQGGTADNVIPESVMLYGTIRYFFEGVEQSPSHPKNRFERIVTNICAAHRAEFELSYTYEHPTLVNHKEMCDLVRTVTD